MEDALNWGAGIVIWFQEFSPTLDLPFKVLTTMGGKEFFMLLLPLVYWCVDRRIGMRLIVLFLLSGYINLVAKALADQPRPFQFDHQVEQLYRAWGGGFPSGHTQNSIVVWGYLALEFRRTWLWIVSGLLMVFIPLSRIYLGVHFPTDLLGGYVLGLAILLLSRRFEPAVGDWLGKKGLGRQIGAALIVPAFLFLIQPGTGEYGIPACATLLGIGLGFALEGTYAGFDPGGIWWVRVLRFMVGGGGIFFIWHGLKVTFSGLEPEPLFQFVRYSMVGLWAGFGAPWVFVRLDLAGTRLKDNEREMVQ
ncbi:MAG: phosphatase PAP2 family protein [Pseudomonadota bacterium]